MSSEQARHRGSLPCKRLAGSCDIRVAVADLGREQLAEALLCAVPFFRMQVPMASHGSGGTPCRRGPTEKSARGSSGQG